MSARGYRSAGDSVRDPVGNPVVIVGAGFGGIQAARTLARQGVSVLLIDRQPYHLFTPFLHQVAMAELEPDQVGIPIRRLLRSSPKVQFLQADVQAIRWDKQRLETSAGQVSFEYLVLATGSFTHAEVPGAAQHTLPLKTLPQAIELRNHILSRVEQAVNEPDPAHQQRLLTFAVIGGGSTGVEVAGSLAEWIQEGLSKDYSMLDRSPLKGKGFASQFRLMVLHSGDRLLETMAPRLSRYTERQLKRLGVEVWLHSRVTQVKAGRITVQTGNLQTDDLQTGDHVNLIEAETIVWAGGIQVKVPELWRLPTAPSGRAATLASLNLPEHPKVYAIGDLAEVGWNDQALPMLAPTADAQGKAVAQNILRQMQGQPPLPYRHNDRGTMAILSRFRAVVQRGKFTMTGFPAWLLWLGFHWFILPGMRQRILVLIHWMSNHLRHDRIPAAVLRSSLQDSSTQNKTYSARSR
ncbi:NAD(P)/FAD-dependent oxidoreductase [Leptolyngbya sp. FACHB-711]|uniref:FAD-dependent oxidoreductase n=1 Tax=unclassified Leptolyngbya TaxID=2650499 RepID=UPI0016852C58|nr:NAD(P)/FAD-dependent oxidoreductase [Cyanobacteria bacterium FACHB-502]MBD2026705.1 NAD(P)/FAD-dependent oxidoreductase [Leptolyngbya sp. FACHB-711]